MKKILLIILVSMQSIVQAATITEMEAFYRNGQVFLPGRMLMNLMHSIKYTDRQFPSLQEHNYPIVNTWDIQIATAPKTGTFPGKTMPSGICVLIQPEHL